MSLGAKPEQLPWHSPGAAEEEKCCCDSSSCTVEPKFSEHTHWKEISEEQYLMLKAGGQWELLISVEMNFSGEIYDLLGRDPWIGSANGSGTATFDDDGGCVREVFPAVAGTVETEENQGMTGNLGQGSYPIIFGLHRRLGTKDGLYYVSFEGSLFGSTNCMDAPVGCKLALPARSAYAGWRPKESAVSHPPDFSPSFKFIIGEETLEYGSSVIEVLIDTAYTVYGYPGLGPDDSGMISIEETGSLSATLAFTPSPP